MFNFAVGCAKHCAAVNAFNLVLYRESDQAVQVRVATISDFCVANSYRNVAGISQQGTLQYSLSVTAITTTFHKRFDGLRRYLDNESTNPASFKR